MSAIYTFVYMVFTEAIYTKDGLHYYGHGHWAVRTLDGFVQANVSSLCSGSMFKVYVQGLCSEFKRAMCKGYVQDFLCRNTVFRFSVFKRERVDGAEGVSLKTDSKQSTI